MPVFLSLKLPVLTAYSDCTLEGEEDHLREAQQCCLVAGAGAGAGARGGSIAVNGSLWAVV